MAWPETNLHGNFIKIYVQLIDINIMLNFRTWKILVVVCCLGHLISCKTSSVRSGNRFRVYWGSTEKRLLASESDRLNSGPVLNLVSSDKRYKMVQYKESLFNSNCFLSYYFKNGLLFMTYYGCNNDDFEEAVLKKKAHRYLESRYGKSKVAYMGQNSFSTWRSDSSNIYLNVQKLRANSMYNGATASIIMVDSGLKNAARVVESLTMEYF